MLEYERTIEAMEMSCDICSETDTEHGSFLDCIDQFKGLGWKIMQTNDDWDHHCPSCAAADPLADFDNI